MSKTILSAFAALAMLSGISSAAIAAPDTNGSGYSSEHGRDSFPANVWNELAKSGA